MDDPVCSTPRLIVRAFGVDDIDGILEVYLSNPGYLELTEGSGGVPGRYDRGMLERDLGLVGLTGRSYVVLVARDGGAIVGVVDWMATNPSDGQPWLGLVMIHADRQRQGLASEALAALLEHWRSEAGFARVRAGVIEGNDPGAALLAKLGFAQLRETSAHLPSGGRTIHVLEAKL